MLAGEGPGVFQRPAGADPLEEIGHSRLVARGGALDVASQLGVALDREGKIYVSDTNFGIFQIFNNEGRILMAVGNRGDGGGPGTFLLPAGISVDVDGRIYVVEQFFRKTEVFRPAAVPEDWPVGQNVA